MYIIIIIILQAVPIQQRETSQLASEIRLSPVPADYLVEINKVSRRMHDVELLFGLPELNTTVYEDFSCRENALKVNRQALHQNGHSEYRNEARNLLLCLLTGL
jgi:hypothetical protein